MSFSFSLMKTFILLTILSVMINTKQEINNLTGSNFELEVKNGKNNKWLVVFYIETCPHCITAKEAISQVVNSDTPQGAMFGQVECRSNMWLCMRFNINRVPYIVLIHDNKMFELDSHPTKTNLISFIENEKELDSALNIPAELTYLDMASKISGEALEMFNEHLDLFVKQKLNLEIDWTTNHTIGLLIAFLVVLFICEWIIILMFCSRRKTKTVAKEERNIGKEKKMN